MKKQSNNKLVRDSSSSSSSSYSKSNIKLSIHNIEYPAEAPKTIVKNSTTFKFKPSKLQKVSNNIQLKFRKQIFGEKELASANRVFQKPPIKSKPIRTHSKFSFQSNNKARNEICLEKILSSDLTSSEQIKKINTFKFTKTKMISSPTDSKENYKYNKLTRSCPETDETNLQYKFIGNCTNVQDMIQKKTKPYAKIKPIQFSRTENAQIINCLRNPNYKEKKSLNTTKVSSIQEIIKLADNIETSSENKICATINLDNPFDLDFQGFDYQHTFKNDEQDLENIREYRKIKRYANRIKRKKEIEKLIKEETIKKFEIPEYFNTNLKYDSNVKTIQIPSIMLLNQECSSSNSLQSNRIGKLYRTEKKPLNRFIIQNEEYQRDEIYRKLILAVQKRNETIEKIQKKLTNEYKKNKNFKVADQNFNDIYIRKFSTFEHLKNIPTQEKRFFPLPHTLNEVKKFQHEIKKSTIISREKAKLRKIFLHEFGLSQKIEEIHPSIADLSKSPTTISEQSSNDDDNLKIGQEGEKVFLRGFHFRFGNEIRGKYSKMDKSPETRLNKKGCLTRDEWIDAMVKRKKIIYRKNRSFFSKRKHSKNTKQFTESKESPSAIRKEINKQFGNQYKNVVSKLIQMKKLKTLKIKKFNLTKFIFGKDETSQIKDFMKSNNFDRTHQGFGNLFDYIRSKSKVKRNKRHQKHNQRMNYLGISKTTKQQLTKNSNVCQTSTTDSENSDWIPEEEYKSKLKVNRKNTITKNLVKSKKTFKNAHYMPASPFRAPTTRRDQNKPRNFKQQISEIVLLDAEHTKVPYLKAPSIDKSIPMRLNETKKEFMKFLNYRQHHDHWQPTQHKELKVLYKPKYPALGSSLEKTKHSDTENYYSTQIFNQINNEERISIKKEKSKITMKTINYPDTPEEYQDRNEFIQLIKGINTKIKMQKDGKTENDDKAERKPNLLDKNKFINELKWELNSIESCLSSLDSSICTTFSNDSGSYLIITDKKLPMNFIRKSLGEINRTRVKAVPISQLKFEPNPYQTGQFFAGQISEQFLKSEDKFHTIASRAQNSIRRRLYVPTLSKNAIGIMKCKKFNPKVSIDLDKIYIEESHNKSSVKIFRPKTSALLIKEAQRKKFVCWCIQQKLFEQKSAEEKQVIYYNRIQNTKHIFNNLFLEWNKTHYNDLKKIEFKIEPNYVKTDELRKKLQELENVQISLSMNIYFIENILIQLTILQNFNYLMMNQAWRQKYDWLHKDENGILENLRISIKKRSHLNIRKRYREDVWTIKEFYENSFVNCKHPIIICFPDYKSFNLAIEDLKLKTFIRLLEFNFILRLCSNLQNQCNRVFTWLIKCNQQKDKFLEMKEIKKNCMRKRFKILQDETENVINEPLLITATSLNLKKMKAFGEILYEKLVPRSVRQLTEKDLDIKSKFALIFESFLDLLAQVDKIPKKNLDFTTIQYRKELKYHSLMSMKAVEIENHLQKSMNTIQRVLKPIKLKTRKEIMAKCGRIKLKKRCKIEKLIEEPVPDKIKFFYKALHDIEDTSKITREDKIEIENNLLVIEEEAITFDFDHFLRINDYEPNYNYKTQIEITDGPEEKYMKYKNLIPYVNEQISTWENLRKLCIKKHIEENPNLYIDIKT